MSSRLFQRPVARTFQHAAGSTLLAGLLLAAAGAHAQTTRGASDHPDSRVDIYAGYGYLHPVNSGIDGRQYKDIYNPNVTASVTGWFNHYLGAQIEGSYFSGGGQHIQTFPACNSTRCDQLVYTAEAGPVFRLPLGRVVPYIHALGGGERINGPAAQPLKWGWGVTGGIGVDIVLPFAHDLFAIRPVQADFQYSQVVYGPLVLPAGITGGFGELDALKLSGGLVARFGEKGDKQPVTLGCTAEPVRVHAGDVVTITGSAMYLNPKRPASYTWTGNGGRITPADSTATVDTTGLGPGEYVVQGVVSQGSRPTQQASCMAPFTVLPVEPPTVTCSAQPANAPSGTTIEISTTGTSPSNRPLTYSYTTTAGQITGTGATATLTTAGLGATTVTVGCNVTDDRGQSAQTTTTVTLENPTVPASPETQSLCTIHFDRDRRRPVRVDNESKACLDDIALTMGQQSSAKLEIIGNANAGEKPETAAERALNERQYLTLEKGIDPSRIEVRVGDTSGRSVRNVLVPNGATFNDANTQTFDESSISRRGQAYGPGHDNTPATGRVHHHRAHRAATPTNNTTTP